MASRSSRSSAKEPLSTPAGVKKERPHSPLSPTKVSRTEEKKQLGQLNDRLAAYIDRVRSLEIENGRLEKKITTLEETSSRESVCYRNNFEQEISQVRAALDQTSRENARLTMEVDKAKLASREATDKLKTKEDEVGRLSRTNKVLEADKRDLTDKLENAVNELRGLRPETESLKKKLADARQKLEDETLKRIDLQNQLQTKEEEAQFNCRVLEQQLNETRTLKTMEVEEVDSRLQQNYEEQLAASLRDLRATYEQQMAENRSGFSAVYDKKIADLTAKLVAERGSAASAFQEMKEMQTRTEGMTSRVVELETTNSALNRRIKELQDQIEEIGRNNRADMARKDYEIDYLNEQLTNLTQEYQELLEIKIALDMEIAAYQKLLDGEEMRLGLSPEKPQPGRGTKRRRMDVQESYVTESHEDVVNCPGPYYIEPVEAERKCIQIKNVGTEELNLGGMVLKCQSEGLESQYKFTRTHKVPAGGTMAVWSSDSDVTHAPGEGRLVMKTGAWKMGDSVTILLLNKEGDQEAMREVSLNLTSSESFSSSEMPASPASVRAVRQTEAEKCVIM